MKKCLSRLRGRYATGRLVEQDDCARVRRDTKALRRTRPLCSDAADFMYHADPTFNRVLTVFLEQGNSSLTPSYIAYELDLTSRAAEQLLDEMVKRSLLELDFDDNGQLYYSVSPDIHFELEQRREERQREARHARQAHHGGHGRHGGRQRATTAGHNDWGQQHGFDGTVGAATLPRPPRAQEPPYGANRRPAHEQASADGCDGTAGYPSDRPEPSAQWDAPPHRERPMSHGAHPRRTEHGQGHQEHQGQQGQQGQRTDLVRYEQQGLMRQRQADPMVAALLSMLFVGSGQIYNREVGKGLAMFVSCAVLWLFSMGWIVNVWAVVDAYGVAARDRMRNDKARTELT